MKNITRIFAFILALTMICLAIAACGKKKEEGHAVAVIDGEVIYDNDPEIVDYMVYYMVINEINIPKGDELTYEYVTAASICTDTVIWNKIYEKELASRGITYKKSDLKDEIESVKDVFSNYEGGYEKFRKDLGLSKNFIYNMAKYAAISADIANILTKECEITDEEAIEYFNLHIEEYSRPKGIIYDAILLEVLDLQDDEEVAAKKAEAQECIARLSGGEDFDTVRKEIMKKYDSDKYVYTSFVSGEAILKDGDYYTVTDLAAEKKLIDETYEKEGIKYDAKADAKSDEFINYQQYLNSIYRAELMYALTTATKTGEIYSEPIYSPVGYVVVKHVGYNETVVFGNFNDSKDEIKSKLFNEKFSTILEDFQNDLIKKYSVRFNKMELEWETKTTETSATTATTAGN